MSIELATAYISLTPSVKGMRGEVEKELGRVADDAAASGDDAGSRFGGGFGTKAKLAMAGTGLAIGGLLVKGTMDAIDRQSANADLAAQLGLDEATAAKVGDAAGAVWANNFGGSIADVNDAIAAVGINLGDLSSMDSEGIQGLTEQAFTLSNVLGEDVGRAARGVGQLIANNLVSDTTTGFDLITAAAQRLPKEMRGELIDTIEEYSSSFGELGITGEQALAAISNSVAAGARNTDLAAGALKEFSIRSIDGSKLTVDAYKALGLNAEKTMKTIADGGPAAAQATSDVIQAIAGVGDQVLQEQIGVALFGTQFEDLGVTAVAALDPLNASLGDINGATQDAADALGGTFAARLGTLKRKGLDALVKAGEKLLPFLEQLVGGVEAFLSAWRANDGDVTSAGFAGFMESFANLLRDIEPTVRSVLGSILDGAMKLFDFFAGNQTVLIAVAAVIGTVVVGAFIAWAVSAAAAAVATLAAIAPFILMAAAVAATAAAVIWAYQNWDWFRVAVDAVAGFMTDVLWPAIKVVVDFIVNDLVPAVVSIVGWLAGAFADNISNIASLFSDLWNAGVEMKDQLVSAFDTVVDFVSDLPGRLLDAGAGLWDFITQPFEDAMNAIRRLWNDTVGGFSVSLPDWLPEFGGKGFTIPKLHAGGIVPGRPGTETLALLQAGEQVISAADVRAMRSVDPVAGGSGRGDINIGTLNTQPRPLLEQFIELQHLMPAA